MSDKEDLLTFIPGDGDSLVKVFDCKDVIFIVDPSEAKEDYDIKTSETGIIGEFKEFDLYIKRTRGPLY